MPFWNWSFVVSVGNHSNSLTKTPSRVLTCPLRPAALQSSEVQKFLITVWSQFKMLIVLILFHIWLLLILGSITQKAKSDIKHTVVLVWMAKHLDQKKKKKVTSPKTQRCCIDPVIVWSRSGSVKFLERTTSGVRCKSTLTPLDGRLHARYGPPAVLRRTAPGVHNDSPVDS